MIARARRLTILLVNAACLLGALASSGCSSRSMNPTAPPEATPDSQTGIRGTPELNRAIEAQERSAPMLLGLPGVVGTSAGIDPAGQGVVRVFVENVDVTGMPREVNGLRVERVVTGRFKSWALTDKDRPLHMGVSIGNENDCAPGTIGCVVERRGHRYALSANHVLARQNHARLGETIVQPNRADLKPTPCVTAPAWSAVGKLTDFQRIFYDGRTPNFMDAAIAELTLAPDLVRGATPRGFYGAPSSKPAAASTGMRVMKLGRTTALTHGAITGVNAKVLVDFPDGVALLVGQLETTVGFGDSGDSGALMVSDDGRNRPVAMVVGGDDTGSAIATPIGRILSRFNVRISGDRGR